MYGHIIRIFYSELSSTFPRFPSLSDVWYLNPCQTAAPVPLSSVVWLRPARRRLTSLSSRHTFFFFLPRPSCPSRLSYCCMCNLIKHFLVHKPELMISQNASPFKPKLHVRPPLIGGTKVGINRLSHLTKLSPCPHMVKFFKLFCRTISPMNLEPDIEHQELQYYKVLSN